MAQISLPENEMSSFDLPRVCVVTGSTENVVFKPVKFQWYPRWIAVFACAPLIMIIVMLILMKRVKGELPFTEEAHAAWKRGQLLFGLSIVGAIALLIAGISQIDNLPALAVALIVAAVAAPVAVGVRFVRGKMMACTRIADGRVDLRIPSEQAAMQISQHLSAGGRRAAAPSAA